MGTSISVPRVAPGTVAVVDIDNTLWQFCDAFLLELRKINVAIPPVEEWTSADFFMPFCTESQFLEAVNAIHRRQDSEEFRPYPEAKGFLRALREQGYRVVVASHRLEETRRPTERWLQRHGLEHDELHLSFDKTVLFRNADVVVDDAPSTLIKAVASRAIGAGLLFPWNRAHAGNGFGLFEDLNEVLAYIIAQRGQGIAQREG